MSCQRGNVDRVRRQKYQNKTVFKNTLHDNSKRTKMINSMEIAEVCKRCQDVIAWKVKYKKYKLLSQPKTCVKCHQKTIKDAYHTVCLTCAKDLEICCKCGKKEEIVAHKSPTKAEQLKAIAQLEMEVKCLSERKRRAYYRYLDKLKGKKKKKKRKEDEPTATNSSETEGVTDVADEKEGENDEELTSLSLEEYFRNAQQKLDELKKGMEGGFDMIDDFDDLSITSDEYCDDSDEN